MSDPITVEFPTARQYDVTFEDGVAAQVNFSTDSPSVEVNFQNSIPGTVAALESRVSDLEQNAVHVTRLDW